MLNKKSVNNFYLLITEKRIVFTGFHSFWLAIIGMSSTDNKNVKETCLVLKRITCLLWVSNRALVYTQSAFTCSKLTIETLRQGVKYVQS